MDELLDEEAQEEEALDGEGSEPEDDGETDFDENADGEE